MLKVFLAILAVCYAAAPFDGLRFSCEDASTTTPNEIYGLQTLLVPLLQSCETSLYRSVYCDLFWAKSHALLNDWHERSCEIPKFEANVRKALSIGGDNSLADIDAALEAFAADLLDPPAAPPAPPSPSLEAAIHNAVEDIITDANGKLAADLTFLNNNLNFWDDATRAADEADFISDIDTALDGYESSWETLLTSEATTITNKLIVASPAPTPGTTLESRIQTKLSNVINDASTQYQNIINSASSNDLESRRLWIELALTNNHATPVFIQFVLPSVTGPPAYTGYITDALQLVRDKVTQLQALGKTIPSSVTNSLNAVVSNIAQHDYASAWENLDCAYDALYVFV